MLPHPDRTQEDGADSHFIFVRVSAKISLPVSSIGCWVRGGPSFARFIGNVQDSEAIQLQMVRITRCPNLVSEWGRESIEGKDIRLERLYD
jgi:hypothetical protein